jgi:uncharacterized iron-regulated protein
MRLAMLLLLWVWTMVAQGDELPPWVSPEGHDDPHAGMVLDTANGIWLTPVMLVESLASATHVLVGEKHDNPDHHRLQLWLLQQLHDRRPQGSLLMEMIEPAQQAAVDRLQNQTPQDSGALERELEWSEGWDWALYGPLVRWGLSHPERLLAANLGAEEMRAIYQAPPPTSPVYDGAAIKALNDAISSSHCSKLPESQFPAMLSIQQARDAHMAGQLIEAPTPALLLAGNFHVRKDLGAPLHWPEEGLDQPLVVMLVEAGSELPDRSQADLVWVTAALPAQDYCAQWE